MTTELDDIFKKVKKTTKKADEEPPKDFKKPINSKLPDDDFADSRGKSKISLE
jgi:hypothetical protein